MPTIPRPTVELLSSHRHLAMKPDYVPTKMICLPSGPSRMPSTCVKTSADEGNELSTSGTCMGEDCGGRMMVAGGASELAFLPRFLEKLLPIQVYR